MGLSASISPFARQGLHVEGSCDSPEASRLPQPLYLHKHTCLSFSEQRPKLRVAALPVPLPLAASLSRVLSPGHLAPSDILCTTLASLFTVQLPTPPAQKVSSSCFVRLAMSLPGTVLA